MDALLNVRRNFGSLRIARTEVGFQWIILERLNKSAVKAEMCNVFTVITLNGLIWN